MFFKYHVVNEYHGHPDGVVYARNSAEAEQVWEESFSGMDLERAYPHGWHVELCENQTPYSRQL